MIETLVTARSEMAHPAGFLWHILWAASCALLWPQHCSSKRKESGWGRGKVKRLKKGKRTSFMFRDPFTVVSHLSQQAKVPVRACGTLPLPKYSEQKLACTFERFLSSPAQEVHATIDILLPVCIATASLRQQPACPVWHTLGQVYL